RLLTSSLSMVSERVGAGAPVEQVALLPASFVHEPDGWLDGDADTAFVPRRAGLYRLTDGARSAVLAVDAAPQNIVPATVPVTTADASIWQPAAWWTLLLLAVLLILSELGLAGWLF